MRKGVVKRTAVAMFMAVLAGTVWVSAGCDTSSSPTTVPSVVEREAVVADGVVLPLQRAELAFSVSGRVKMVLVQEGEAVVAGQVLATLDDAAARAALAATEAELRSAQAALEQAQANEAAAQAAVDKAKATEDGVPSGAADWRFDVAAADVAAAEAQLASARAAVTAAEAAVTAATARLNQAEVALSDLTLVAPFAGTVVDVNIKTGDLAGPGLVAVRVADLTDWEIETTDLSEASLPDIKVGAAVEVTFDALPGVVVRGEVKDIGRFGASYQGTVVFPVTVTLAQEVEGLRWGLTATVKIPVD